MRRAAEVRRPVRRRRRAGDRRCLEVWQGVREHRGWLWAGAGAVALGLYGFAAALQPSAEFGRVLAAYGGVFIAGSLAWAAVADGYRPDRYDLVGAAVCLVGAAVIVWAPRGAA